MPPIQFPGVPPAGSAGGVEGPKKPARPSRVERPGQADQVRFSPRAQEALKLREHLARLPEVREARVETLRRQISAGTYGPDARAVAAGLLRSKAVPQE